MMEYVYIKPTKVISADKQRESVSKAFEVKDVKFIEDSRATTRGYRRLLNIGNEGDVVYCHTPSIFGASVEHCSRNLRSLLAKGVLIKSVLYGDITGGTADGIEIAEEIRLESIALTAKRGYGRYIIPKYIKSPKKHTDSSLLRRRDTPSIQWIDRKILEGWATKDIYEEHQLLVKILGVDVWEDVNKGFINVRRREITT